MSHYSNSANKQNNLIANRIPDHSFHEQYYEHQDPLPFKPPELSQDKYYSMKIKSEFQNQHRFPKNKIQIINQNSSKFLAEFEELFFEERQTHSQLIENLKAQLNTLESQNLEFTEELIASKNINAEMIENNKNLEIRQKESNFNYKIVREFEAIEKMTLNCQLKFEDILSNQDFKKMKRIKKEIIDFSSQEIQQIRFEKLELLENIKQEIDKLNVEKYFKMNLISK